MNHKPFEQMNINEIYVWVKDKHGQQYAAFMYPDAAKRAGDPPYRCPKSTTYTTEPSDASGFSGDVEISIIE
jgi:hypothetical protein